MSFPSLFRVQRRDPSAVRVAHPAFPLMNEVNQLFDDFFRDFPTGGGVQAGFVPSLGIEETPDAVRITAELPGLDEKDFEITVEEGIFTLRGEKRQEREAKDEKAGWVRSERAYGRFERRIALAPELEVDKAKASFKNGVLEVTLPKAPEAKPKTHTISVNAG